MNESCPISNKAIDSRIVRLVAFQVLMLGLVFLMTGQVVFLYILLLDYIMRSIKALDRSPLLCFANLASQVIGLKPKMCDEAPKRFALYLGMSVVVVALLSYLMSYTTIAQGLIITLALFASLDAFFDYCVGCKIYQMVSYLRRRL